jgi:GNAT superfamily N-acetyltransferase
MGIRLAVAADIPKLIELGREMHLSTRFKAMPFEPERVSASIQAVVAQNSGRYLLIVAESGEGEIVGVLAGVIELPVFSSVSVASVMHFDVLQGRRAGGWGVSLLHAFEQWATRRGVFEIVVGVNSGRDWERTGRFLRKASYQMTGENFVKGCI